MEGGDIFGLATMDMCLVSDLIISTKLKCMTMRSTRDIISQGAIW